MKSEQFRYVVSLFDPRSPDENAQMLSHLPGTPVRIFLSYHYSFAILACL